VLTEAIARRPGPVPRERNESNEFWLVAAALLLTAVIPGLSKYQAYDASGNSPASEFLWSLMYLVAAMRLYAMRAVAVPMLARSGWLWAFLGLMFVSVLWSVDPMTTFKNSIELIGTTLVGFYIVTRFTLPQFITILALTFSAIAIMSLGFIFGAPGHGRMDWGTGAWEGIYQDKNNLGAAASLAIISQVILCAISQGRSRAIAFVGLALFGAILVGSNSATAFADCAVVLAAVLAGFACRSSKFGVTARLLTIIVVAVAVIAVGFFGLTPESAYGVLGRAPNLTGRTDFWPYLQQAVADRPLIGYGYNAFFRSAVGAGYLSDYIVQAGGWTPYHAHNSFLQISLDAGYIGLASFLILLLCAFWRGVTYFAREQSRVAAWPVAITLYLFLGSFTETYFGNYNTLEWILFVVALLYPLRDRLSIEASKASEPSTIRGRR